MFTAAKKAVSCMELLEDYKENKTVQNPHKLEFLGVDGYDVYNISSEFESNGEYYIAGRVEKRENELSHVRIFEKVGEYTYKAAYPELTFEYFQDPCVTKINGQLVLGGVQIICNPLNSHQIVSWHMCFYKGESLDNLSLFAMGPSHMKDIRLAQLPRGRVGIFTRPQGKAGGKGRIGFLAVDSLDEVSGEDMLKAEIFDTHFLPEEWGGANEMHLLKNGLLGVMGHISYMSEKDYLHYHPMCFVFNPETLEHTPVKIVVRRSDISRGPSKYPRLVDVLFTGGIVRHADGKATLYTGVSDCEAYCVEIEDPFKAYEDR